MQKMILVRIHFDCAILFDLDLVIQYTLLHIVTSEKKGKVVEVFLENLICNVFNLKVTQCINCFEN